MPAGASDDRLLTIEEATLRVRQRLHPLPAQRRPLADALGCMLAEDVKADLDLPPFDKALMDGYAVRASDLGDLITRLDLGEEIPAGRTPSRPLEHGEAALIMTGAPLPHGADTVVMIERTRREGNTVVFELAGASARPGQNWLVRGREMRAGEIVMRQGTLLNPVRLGLLASVGRPDVSVIPRPRVAIVPTGDELVEPDRMPGPGQIRNSNAVTLRALAGATGAEAEALPIVPDEPGPLTDALRRGLAFDVLAITGGVSAGNRDLVPETLAHLGVERVFHKLRVKPGKPLWFGVGPPRGDATGTLVFGLPGNPVSGVVGFLLFVRPALLALAGRPSEPVLERLPLSRGFTHAGDRPTYHPSRRVEGGDGPTVEPLTWAGSADLRTVAGADGFAVFPAGDREYTAGEVVEFLDLG